MELATLRDDMVEGLAHPTKDAVRSERVSMAMRTVPRHEFVPGEPETAYEDREYDHEGTTVLAPSLAARLLEALDVEAGLEVLIVGAGVGYTAALAAELAGGEHVSAVDLSRPLVWEARRNLGSAGYGDVLVERSDGANGLPRYAPFDRILVEAAAIEPPRRLLEQLAPAGRLVLPLGGGEQELVAHDDEGVVDRYGPVRFRPLLLEGEQTGGIERNRAVRETRERAADRADRRHGWEYQWIDWDRQA